MANDKKHYIVDLRNKPTLAIAIQEAFTKAAPAYGVRLVGIEDDINEHMDLWYEVARIILEAP